MSVAGFWNVLKLYICNSGPDPSDKPKSAGNVRSWRPLAPQRTPQRSSNEFNTQSKSQPCGAHVKHRSTNLLSRGLALLVQRSGGQKTALDVCHDHLGDCPRISTFGAITSVCEVIAYRAGFRSDSNWENTHKGIPVVGLHKLVVMWMPSHLESGR